MMKRMLLVTLVGIFCFAGNLNAINPYQSLRNHVVGFGDRIENINNIPLIDKLVNLLPFAMVAACFQKCPGQTMVVLTGLLAYVLSQNESVRTTLSKYNLIGFMGQKNDDQTNNIDSDDTLFVFDGEDEDDAQEEDDVEDEMLESELSDEEYYDKNNSRRPVEQSAIKFL